MGIFSRKVITTASLCPGWQRTNAGEIMKTYLAILSFVPVLASAAPAPGLPTFEQYLRESATNREAIEKSLHNFHRWQFDSELGVVDGKYVGEVGGLPGGIDGSANVGTFRADGARTSFMYTDQRPRINTYGDSFTHGDQVNDGETWQEYLAAHLREPIGNFGVGGYGVYQAYRRIIREENTDHAAKYLILTICCDDSTRSLFRSWYPITRTLEHRVFAGAKPNVELDLNTRRFVEKENLLPTEQSLYHLTESQWIVDHLKGDYALQLQLYGGDWWVEKQRIRHLDHYKISKLAAALDFTFDWNLEGQTDTVPSRYAAYGVPSITRMQAQAQALLNRYAQRATIYILDKARTYAEQHGKKLLVVLVLNTDGAALQKTGARDNQEVVDFLNRENFYYFDIDQALVDDYKKANTNLSFSDYVKKYMVNGEGHLNPTGNHFFAYSLKDKLIDWLDPKPTTYERRGSKILNEHYFFDARPVSGDR
jgi:hypothetical protein